MGNEEDRKPVIGTAVHVLTMLFGTWLILGVFIDGWAHNNLDSTLETFFTPWHGVLYSGYAASALWLGWLAYQGYRRTGSWKQGMPDGYGLGVAGAVIFLCGGIGDMLWHIFFGIEVGIEALYSPTHLLLFAGAALIVTSPFRTLWRSLGPEPSFGQLWPGLLSLSLGTALTGFFAMSFWMFQYSSPSQPAMARTASRLSVLSEGYRHNLTETLLEKDIAGILLTTAILIVPLIWAGNRWKLPVGSLFLLITLPVSLMAILDESYIMILSGAGAGIGAELLQSFLGVSPRNTWRKHALFTCIPLLWTGLYFLQLHLQYTLGWHPNFWGGSMVLSAMIGLTLSHMVAMNRQEPGRTHSRGIGA